MVQTDVLDAKIPFLAAALDLPQAHLALRQAIPDLRRVTAATLVRHKPERRALIAYTVETATDAFTALGKIRAKGTDWRTYRLQQALWHQGFAADSADGYSVPEPIGVVPVWQMWLQRQVPGIPATELLPTDRGVALAGRIAHLAHKLHRTNIPAAKNHTLADELNILHQRLPLVSQDLPHLQPGIEQVLDACTELVASTSVVWLPCCGIHRDFYGDQVLVESGQGQSLGCDRIWLVDLDLYCQGHPALDIGNFVAHITEQSLRQGVDAAALADREKVLQETFVAAWIASNPELANRAEDLRYAIALYAALTLVRHIHISHRIASRRSLTREIVALCKSRLQTLLDQRKRH
ncbi:MAG TPA: phosphotransferase [Trichocoleus sp.]